MSASINRSPNASPVLKVEPSTRDIPLSVQTDNSATSATRNSNPPSAITDSGNNGATDSSAGPIRRKTNRRANTAERRATHNAVERQRRETLNGRFLDLAGLLPNLASVRRPSKSAIVNSSIAVIHQQRRARGVAARELRILKAETDLLRREVNEWRDRARLPPADEPVRSQDFHVLMALEEVEENDEERAAYAAAQDEMEEDDGYDNDEMEIQQQPQRPTSGGRGMQMQGMGMQITPNHQHMGMMPMGVGMGGMGMQLPPPQPSRYGHSGASYGPSGHHQMSMEYSVPNLFDNGVDKTTAWAQQQAQQAHQQQQQQAQQQAQAQAQQQQLMNNMLQNQQQQWQILQQQQQAAQAHAQMYTPPGSSHGAVQSSASPNGHAPSPSAATSANPLVAQAQQAFLANYQRNAQVLFPSGAASGGGSGGGSGFPGLSTASMTPPSSTIDGEASIAGDAASVHSSPGSSLSSPAHSLGLQAGLDLGLGLGFALQTPLSAASTAHSFSASPPAMVSPGSAGPTSSFVPSHSRRTSAPLLPPVVPAPAMWSSVPAGLGGMGVGVGGSYASNGLSLFA